MVLIDFDGVISRNIVSMMLKATHQFMTQYVPLPWEIARQGMKGAVCMPVEASVRQGFQANGLEEKIPEFIAVMSRLEEYVGEEVTVRPGFYDFIALCEVQGIPYRLFSAANPQAPHVQKLLGRLHNPDLFFPLEGYSKQSVKTYPYVAEALKIDLNRCLMVDDACQALAIAGQFGVHTVMMTNDLFTEDDFAIWQPHIDHMADTFEEVSQIMGIAQVGATTY